MYRREEIKYNELEEGKSFEKCELGREVYADNLTNIIESQQNGFVLAINNKWGTGKSTFINMWRHKLEDIHGFSTIYLNAWENDFDDNPLSTLIAEFKSLGAPNKNNSNVTFDSVLEKASIFSKNIAPAVLVGLAKKFAGNESINAILEGVAKGATDMFTNEVKTYLDKKEDLKHLKTQLEKYVADNANGKNLIFFIDELDRCRPNYAVSLLEQIKHFFNVPNIVFVLSIDKIQLGHAVRGVYGSEQIEAESYLKRFIDIEYTIPEPDPLLYIGFLTNEFKIKELLQKNKNRFNEELASKFTNISLMFLDSGSVSLRDLDKYFIYLALTLRSFEEQEFIPLDLLLFLIYLKMHDQVSYQKILNRNFEWKDLGSVLKNQSNTKYVENTRHLIKLEGKLYSLYMKYTQPNFNALDNNFANLKSVFGGTHNEILNNYIVNLELNNAIDLKSILDKINLLSHLRF